MTMKSPKLILALVTSCSLVAQAGVYDNTFSSGFANSGDIPVGNTAGWSSSETLSGETGTIGSITVNLDISGGFNGSLYGYLEYDGVLVTLLNRVGVVSGNSFGYFDSGMDITLSSSAANNIHSYQNYSPSYNGSGQLTGSWQPDGNTVSPLSSPASFSANPSGSGLNSFNGLSPDGTWTLFLADVVSGGPQPQILSYGLDITTVPEPVDTALGIFAGLFILVGLWRTGLVRRLVGKTAA
jgi:hypothetical protein